MAQPSAAVTCPEHEARPCTSGVVVGFFAFFIWGLLPLYWKQLAPVAAMELMCHRMVWSALFTAIVLTLSRRWREVGQVLGSRASLLWLTLTAALLSVNWWTFIWAVNADFVLETSLGYYINPLVNVVLGYVFLRDKLRRFQIVAVCLALAGVLNLVLSYGRFPWIALVLALTFGFYGLVRKTIQPGPLAGLFAETTIASIIAGPYLIWLESRGLGGLGHVSPKIDVLILLTGAATSVPLIFFSYGARRLRLATLGILQYTAPTCFFILGAFVFHEPFTWAHGVTFGLIWCGIALYSWEGLRQACRARLVLQRCGTAVGDGQG